MNNLVWNGEGRDSSDSLPVGGHDVGCNVWVQDGEVLVYVQQGGGFDENSSLLKQARLRIRWAAGVFGAGLRQEFCGERGFVRLSDGEVGRTRLDVWVESDRPVVHVDGDFPASHVEVRYESWRTADRIVPSHSAELFQAKEVWMYPGTVTFHRDQVDAGDGWVEFHHRNETDLSFDKEMDAQGLARIKGRLPNPQFGLTTGGRLEAPAFLSAEPETGVHAGMPYVAWPLRSTGPVTSLALRVVLHTAPTATLGQWRDGLDRTARSAAADAEARERTEAWWRNFHALSRIDVAPGAGGRDLLGRLGRNAGLFRHLLGCNAKGAWPTKFNGGLFTFDPSEVDPAFPYSPDYRRWSGGTFTTQNQRLVHWPMLKNGDFGLLPVFFDFYLRLLPTELARVKATMNLDGACYPEQLNWYGLCATVDHGWTNTSGLPVPQIRYLFSNQLEIGYLMLEYCRYTAASAEPYLEFLDQTLRFYEAFYPETENGRMVLYPANALETYHPVRDPADAVAGLATVVERLLELPLRLAGSSRRRRWERLLSRVPELPHRVMHGRRVLAAARTESPIHNCELPQLYPVFPYGRFGLGQPDLQVAIDTARYTVETGEQLSHFSWQNLGLAYARLGMISEAFEFLKRKLADGPHRFPAFWGPGHDWTPDHNWGGSGCLQLQEMLLQTPGRRLLVFPCWDANIDVRFRLHAPHRTVVEAELNGGRVVSVRVEPRSRSKDVEVML